MVLRHFDLSSSPYDEARVGSIQTRRSRYPDGQLFIDRLLNLAGIDGECRARDLLNLSVYTAI